MDATAWGIVLSILGVVLSLAFGIRAEITKNDLNSYKAHVKNKDLLNDLNAESIEIVATSKRCLRLIDKHEHENLFELNTSLIKLRSQLRRCIERYHTLFNENGVCDSDLADINKLVSIIDLQSKMPDIEMPDLANADSKKTYIECLVTVKTVFGKGFKLYE